MTTIRVGLDAAKKYDEARFRPKITVIIMRGTMVTDRLCSINAERLLLYDPLRMGMPTIIKRYQKNGQKMANLRILLEKILARLSRNRFAAAAAA